MRSGCQTDHEERCDAGVSRRGAGKGKRVAVETVVGGFDDRECVRGLRCVELGTVCECSGQDLGPPPHLPVTFYYFLNASFCELWILVSRYG
jgi:hypothetical protein